MRMVACAMEPQNLRVRTYNSIIDATAKVMKLLLDSSFVIDIIYMADLLEQLYKQQHSRAR